MDALSKQQILQSVLPMYGLIILGGVLRKTGVLAKTADTSLMKLVINCLYPCLILDKILSSDSVKDPSLVVWTLPMGFIIITLGIFLARGIGNIFKIEKGASLNTFATTSGIQNYGFAAVPIVMALFPDDLLGVLFVHSLGVEICLWTVGIACLQGSIPKSFKSLISPPILAVIIGLTLTFTGLGDTLKSTTTLSTPMTLMNWLGACSFPLALMLVGATLSDELKACIPSLKVAGASILLRIILMPMIIIALAALLPMPKSLAIILIIQAAMPSAVMPIVLAKLYGGKPAIAGQVVITTQVVGIITIPIWITLGLKFIT